MKINPTEAVLRCCLKFPSVKLDPITISLLTRLPMELVNKELDGLKKKEALPKQYLTHLLN